MKLLTVTVSLQVNKEKGQALVEFLTPEDASAALNFDGKSFSGNIIKIRRPKDYVESSVRLITMFTYGLACQVNNEQIFFIYKCKTGVVFLENARNIQLLLNSHISP